MFKELFEAMSANAAERFKPHFIPQLCDSNHVAYVLDGQLHQTPTPDVSRSFQVFDIASLVKAVEQFGDVQTAAFVSVHSIRVLLDESDRRQNVNTVQMALSINPIFAQLRGNQNRWLSQKESVEFLRHNLSWADVSPPILPVIRKMTFSTNASLTGDISNTTAALDKSIMAEVTGSGDLPETFSLEFHPYPQLHEEFPSLASVVMCSLFTDAERGALKFAPLPGEIERAELAAASAIAEAISGHDIETFLGEL